MIGVLGLTRRLARILRRGRLGALIAGVAIAAPCAGSLVPLPKMYRKESGIFRLDERTIVWGHPENAAVSDLVRDLERVTGLRLAVKPLPAGAPIPDTGIVVGDVGAHPGLAVAASRSVPQQEQGYFLSVRPRRVLLCGRDAPGAYYATRTLLQMLSGRGGRFWLPAVTIRDWPDMAWRGVYPYFMAPEDATFRSFREWIDSALAVKLNLFAFTDPMIHFDRADPAWPDDKRRSFHAELRAVVDYARKRHMKIIVFAFVDKFPVIYAPSYIIHKPAPAVHWFPDEAGKQLIRKKLEELVDCVRPDVISINQDEIISDYSPWKRRPTLTAPAPLREAPPPGRYGPETVAHELWADFLNYFHSVIRTLGVQMAMWGDCLLSSQELHGHATNMKNGAYGGPPDNLYLARDRLPKDILILDWKYDSQWSFPSIDIFRAAGFPFLAASYKRLTNIFFLSKYAKEHGGPNFRGLLGTWWDKAPPASHEHVAACSWNAGRLEGMPAYLARLSAVADEAMRKPLERLRPGRFRREISFLDHDAGHFLSAGWYEGGVAIDDRQEERFLGISAKPGRQGFIDYRLAGEKARFARLVVRPWFDNPGANAIFIKTGPLEGDDWYMLKGWTAAAADRNWDGEPVDLSPWVRGHASCYIRFWFEVSADRARAANPCFRRFSLEGELTAEER